MEKIQTFQDLIVWKKAHSLTLKMYQLTKSFPPDERFGLTDQMRRAAISIGSNIAEGYGRGTAKDKIQFYLIAKGSLCELHSQYLIAKDIGYAKEEIIKIEDFDEVSKLIAGLIKSSPSRPILNTAYSY